MVGESRQQALEGYNPSQKRAVQAGRCARPRVYSSEFPAQAMAPPTIRMSSPSINKIRVIPHRCVTLPGDSRFLELTLTIKGTKAYICDTPECLP